MGLTITSGQTDATQRRTCAGVVYALSGTLLSRVSGLPPVEIRWANRSFSGGPTGDHYEAYLTLPSKLEGELPFRLGESAPLHVFDLPVRNLPFQHSESIFTAIVDEDYAWEGSTATLYVGYLDEEQGPGDLAAADWTSLRLRGQFGAPKNVAQDGFVLPLLSRDTLRRQKLRFPIAGRDTFPNVAPADEGRVIPVVVGAPNEWVPMLRIDAGIYGLTTEATVSGTTNSFFIESDFDNVDDLIGEEVYFYTVDAVLTVTGVDDLRDQVEEAPWRVHFASTVNFNVPAGALIQQRKTKYSFLPALNGVIGIESGPSQWGGIEGVAFELFDGRIVPFRLLRGVANNFSIISNTGPELEKAYFGSFTTFDILDTEQPPAFVPRLNLPSAAVEVTSDDVDVTTQPEFALDVTTVEATKPNVPDGPGFASAAFDGNDQTGYSVAGNASVTFTFPDVTGGVFSNGDTIRSTLRFTSQGTFTVTDASMTTFANVAGSKGSYTITPGSPSNFNQSVRFAAGPFGGIVFELSWEHELQATNDIQRTADTAVDADIAVESANDPGNQMFPIKRVVYRPDNTFTGGSAPTQLFGNGPWREIKGTFPFERVPTNPADVFANLQRCFVENTTSGGGVDHLPTIVSAQHAGYVNLASYEAAALRYRSENLRLNFAITEQISWPEIEKQLALQCRSHAFFGPQGHELIYIEDAATLEATTPEAEFRLPGVPNPNASVAAGQPVMERTSPADVVNRVDVYYQRRWLFPKSDPPDQRYAKSTFKGNAESQEVFGRLYDTQGPITAWGISEASRIVAGDSYSASGQAADLGNFYTERFAFARTRFVFETAWNAFSVSQGSVVTVVFASADGVYRNVVCEVEDVKVSPINADRRVLTCRSLASPRKGLTVGYVWTDVWDTTGLVWPDRITGSRDRWEHYFGVR